MSDKLALMSEREREIHKQAKRSGAVVGFVAGVAVSALIAVLIQARKAG
jgi:tetrahydromethanopterin S-methyltransferase subunit B